MIQPSKLRVGWQGLQNKNTEVGACFGITALGTDVCSRLLVFWFCTVVVLLLSLRGGPRNLFGPLGNVLYKACGGALDNAHVLDDLHVGNTSHSPLSLKPPASLEAATHIG